MVKKLLYWPVAILFLITIYLTVFTFLLHTFQSPLDSNIKESTAHTATWIYLLQQHYIAFIEDDIFNIYEKRHLLDVKKIFKTIESIWLFSLLLSTIMTMALMTLQQLKIVLYYFYKIGLITHLLLISLSLNFLNSFSYLHSFLFPKNSWTFPKDSILIEWFPLHYFQEFFILFLILTLLLFFLIFYMEKIFFFLFIKK
jgi:uncharacterized membrane protein